MCLDYTDQLVVKLYMRCEGEFIRIPRDNLEQGIIKQVCFLKLKTMYYDLSTLKHVGREVPTIPLY